MAGLSASVSSNIPSFGSASSFNSVDSLGSNTSNLLSGVNADNIHQADQLVEHSNFPNLYSHLTNDSEPGTPEDPTIGMNDSELADYHLDEFAQEYYQKYLETGDNAWLEKYLDTMLNIKSTYSAREWEEMMSNTAFSRLVADIKAAGYNPWIALQSGYGQASTPSVSAAQSSNVSYSEQKTNRDIARMQMIAQIISGILHMIGGIL